MSQAHAEKMGDGWVLRVFCVCVWAAGGKNMMLDPSKDNSTLVELSNDIGFHLVVMM